MDKEKSLKILFGLLGLALILAAWDIRGLIVPKKPAEIPLNPAEQTKIPEQFWEGGENTLTIEASNSTISTMHISLEGPDPQKPSEERWQEATEEKAPGNYQWTVRFPKEMKFGKVEWSAKTPIIGDSLQWDVKLNDQSIQKSATALDSPPLPNTTMFLQVDLDPFFKHDEPSQDSAQPGPGTAQPDQGKAQPDQGTTPSE